MPSWWIFLLGELTEFSSHTSEALFDAITWKHFGVAERLLQDPRIEISGCGALKEVCRVQNAQLALTLLDDPRGLSAKDKSEALALACCLLKFDVFFRLLADPNINPNQRGDHGGISVGGHLR